MTRALFLLRAAALAAPLSAQPLPFPQPPYPPPSYPQPQGPYPAMPPVPGPVLALPVLKADLIARSGTDTVRFGRDSYVLNPQAQATLAAQAQWLIAHPYVRASIEGHADTRQTREYALALGERRAAAVRNYLIASGVPPQQLDVVSWGKERPTTSVAHDATWLQNSRAVTVLKQPPPQLQPWSPQPEQQPPVYR